MLLPVQFTFFTILMIIANNTDSLFSGVVIPSRISLDAVQIALYALSFLPMALLIFYTYLAKNIKDNYKQNFLMMRKSEVEKVISALPEFKNHHFKTIYKNFILFKFDHSRLAKYAIAELKVKLQ